MHEFKTRDVSLAAFFRFKGHRLVRFQTVKHDGHIREGEWFFDLTEDQADALKVEYVNSDIAEFEGIRRGMAKQKYR